MKCDLLQENELNEKISNRTGFNIDRAFQDILVQSYNKYHPNDLILTSIIIKKVELIILIMKIFILIYIYVMKSQQ